jgi:hypothetical protein
MFRFSATSSETHSLADRNGMILVFRFHLPMDLTFTFLPGQGTLRITPAIHSQPNT